jgi:hypothetical protein
MTDNKLWDKVIEPKMEVDLTKNKLGRKRGIKLKYRTEDTEFVAIEESFNDVGTNYKKAKQMLINQVRPLYTKY